jgi:hypothetical protein
LEKIDVLVLPYGIDTRARVPGSSRRPSRMRSRSFCSAQTALVDFLTERNGESVRTDEEFASSLLKILLNYDRYLDRAILAAARRYRVLEANALRDNICGSALPLVLGV